MAMLGSMTAEERMATFILNMSARFSALGYSASEFRIQMTRDDMGSYLGLRLETVSRILHRLQDLKLIAINGRELQILDRPALEGVSHARGEPRPK
jgi:CRP/FNR family transcriptional regulator